MSPAGRSRASASRRHSVTGEPMRYQFGVLTARVRCLLHERRRNGDCTVTWFEALREHFLDLLFFDFLGGFIRAWIQRDSNLVLVFPKQGGRA